MDWRIAERVATWRGANGMRTRASSRRTEGGPVRPSPPGTPYMEYSVPPYAALDKIPLRRVAIELRGECRAI